MGRGVAGAIAFSGGLPLKESVKEEINKNKSPFKKGDVFISSSGFMNKRGIKNVYHAVTMDYPGGITDIETICKLTQKVFDLAIANGVKSIALPGLGCGIGRLDVNSIANKIAQIALRYEGQININIVDANPNYINAFKKHLKIQAIFEDQFVEKEKE